MRIAYIPHNQRDWEVFFKAQYGHGLGGFSGTRYQRGAGIGSIFSGLFRSLLPVAKSIGKAVGKQALRTGAHIASDALEGRDIGEAFAERGKEGASALLKKGVKRLNKRSNQSGSGGPRRKKARRIATRRRRSRTTRRKMQRGRGLGSRPTTRTASRTIKGVKRQKKLSVKKRKHTDQLGSYYS